MTENYIDKFTKIEPLISCNSFFDTVQRTKHYWNTLKDFKLHENISIIGPNETMMVAVPSFHHDRFTKLDLSRCGACARITYKPEYGGATLNLFIGTNNKLKAITSHNNDTNLPLIDLFYGSDFVRFFHIVIPHTEVSEVLFQYSTVSSIDLSFIEDFL